ncbi:Glycogen debranching enzyme [Frankliniella fusca]|uniref:Glycogen debranching enzyme n=1 Tax=Frankliniella fusca TaxID=407009 RepID=A0AAE1LU21_9NEOP|nr:Glycogen debranching enzyme [Frankliniella fusca]
MVYQLSREKVGPLVLAGEVGDAGVVADQLQRQRLHAARRELRHGLDEHHLHGADEEDDGHERQVALLDREGNVLHGVLSGGARAKYKKKNSKFPIRYGELCYLYNSRADIPLLHDIKFKQFIGTTWRLIIIITAKRSCVTERHAAPPKNRSPSSFKVSMNKNVHLDVLRLELHSSRITYAGELH